MCSPAALTERFLLFCVLNKFSNFLFYTFYIINKNKPLESKCQPPCSRVHISTSGSVFNSLCITSQSLPSSFKMFKTVQSYKPKQSAKTQTNRNYAQQPPDQHINNKGQQVDRLLTKGSCHSYKTPLP